MSKTSNRKPESTIFDVDSDPLPWTSVSTSKTKDPSVQSVLSFSTEHPQWADQVVLEKGGRFIRQAIQDGGSWTITGKILTLKWDQSQPEMLITHDCGKTFEGGSMKMVCDASIHPDWWKGLFGFREIAHQSPRGRTPTRGAAVQPQGFLVPAVQSGIQSPRALTPSRTIALQPQACATSIGQPGIQSMRALTPPRGAAVQPQGPVAFAVQPGTLSPRALTPTRGGAVQPQGPFAFAVQPGTQSPRALTPTRGGAVQPQGPFAFAVQPGTQSPRALTPTRGVAGQPQAGFTSAVRPGPWSQSSVPSSAGTPPRSPRTPPVAKADMNTVTIASGIFTAETMSLPRSSSNRSQASMPQGSSQGLRAPHGFTSAGGNASSFRDYSPTPSVATENGWQMERASDSGSTTEKAFTSFKMPGVMSHPESHASMPPGSSEVSTMQGLIERDFFTPAGGDVLSTETTDDSAGTEITRDRALPEFQIPELLQNQASHAAQNQRAGAGWPAVGNRVEAWHKSGEWYAATVKHIISDDSYLVAWDNNDPLDTVKKKSQLRHSREGSGTSAGMFRNVQPQEAQHTPPRMPPSQMERASHATQNLGVGAGWPAVGDKVEAWHKCGEWYAATVKHVISDDSYLVAWDDNDPEDTVKKKKQLRKPRAVGLLAGVFANAGQRLQDGLQEMGAKAEQAIKRPAEANAGKRLKPVKPANAKPQEAKQTPSQPRPGKPANAKPQEAKLTLSQPEEQVRVSNFTNFDMHLASGPQNLAPHAAHNQKAEWPAVGDKVEAQYHSGKWYAATVIQIRSNGEYVVQWEDGDPEDTVKKKSQLRRVHQVFGISAGIFENAGLRLQEAVKHPGSTLAEGLHEIGAKAEQAVKHPGSTLAEGLHEMGAKAKHANAKLQEGFHVGNSDMERPTDFHMPVGDLPVNQIRPDLNDAGWSRLDLQDAGLVSGAMVDGLTKEKHLKKASNETEVAACAHAKDHALKHLGSERAKKYMGQLAADPSPGRCYRALGCCLSYMVLPFLGIAYVIFLFYRCLFRALYSIYVILPVNVLKIIFGLALCFFGGKYFLSIAAIEAFRNFGGIALLRDLNLMCRQVKRALKAIDKDEVKNKELRRSQIILHKVKVGMAAITRPVLLMKAMTNCLTVWLTVLAVLKFEFAKTIALCLGIADILKMPFSVVFGPALTLIYGRKLKQWVLPTIGAMLKIISVICAVFVQQFISAFYAGIRGGSIFADGFIEILFQYGYMDELPDWVIEKPFNPDKSMWDETIGYPVAALGFYFQSSHGFSLPFPLNIVFLPLTSVEWFLRLEVFAT